MNQTTTSAISSSLSSSFFVSPTRVRTNSFASFEKQPLMGKRLSFQGDKQMTDVTLSSFLIKNKKNLDKVTALDLMGTSITGKGLKALSDCKNLETLDLTNTKITNEMLNQYLPELPSLQKLWINNCPSLKVTDDKLLTWLNRTPNIIELNTVNSKIEPKLIPPLKKLELLYSNYGNALSLIQNPNFPSLNLVWTPLHWGCATNPVRKW